MATPSSFLTRAQQNEQELEQFLQYVRANKVESYCEIGCKFGGLLWAVAQCLPSNARVVGVDLPNSPAWGRSDSEESLRNCFDTLRKRGHDAHLLIGDSTSASIVAQVERLAPFDLLFIDANHTETYVRKDFANYGKLANIVCFHDIARDIYRPGRLSIEVAKVWTELKMTLAHAASFKEIKLDDGQNGIGILRWV